MVFFLKKQISSGVQKALTGFAVMMIPDAASGQSGAAYRPIKKKKKKRLETQP